MIKFYGTIGFVLGLLFLFAAQPKHIGFHQSLMNALLYAVGIGFTVAGYQFTGLHFVEVRS